MHIDNQSRDRSDRAQSGLTLIEMLVAMAIGLFVLLAVFGFMDWSRRTYVRQSGQVEAQAAGRVALDLLTSDLRRAGYNPLGMNFAALPAGNSGRVRLLADLDGDGVVGTSTETDENITYEFAGPDASGVYELRRGVDLNGDGDFADTDESFDVLASNVIPVDVDLDGSNEAFIAFDTGAATTARRVILTFGIRSRYRDIPGDDYDFATFHSSVAPRSTVF